MAARIEIPEWVNEQTVEQAFRICKRAQETRREILASYAMRAARERDPRLLMALEGGSQVLERMSRSQLGLAGLDHHGQLVEATEFQLWRNAYVAVDKGDLSDAMHYQWILVAAGILAGIIH